MLTIPCTNRKCRHGQMMDMGNYFFCPACKSLDFKLIEQDTPWMPLPKQESFLYSPTKYTLYKGGVGSGKTMVGCYKAIMKALQHPNGMGLIGAQVYPQLRDATMQTFWEVCPERLMKDGKKDKAFSKTDAILTMHNGHQILFRPLDDESKLRSLNLVWFWIDEASEVQEDIFLMLQSRLRSRQGFINGVPAHQGWVTTNPAGHDWLWKIFVSQLDPEYSYVTAPTRENKYLPPGFEEGLRRRWPESWVKRFLDGSSDVFEGMIYPMLDRELHGHIPVDFYLNDIKYGVPPGWPVFVSLDHGVTNPTAVGFYTITPDERPIKFDELYEANKPVSYHAQKIKEKLWSWGVNPETVADWLIDPSTRGQRGMTGRAVMAEYHDQGLPFRPANNNVQAGILQVIEYLMPDASGQPYFYIHPRCVNSWRESTSYKWKKAPASAATNEPEEPVKKDDHTCDDDRYLLMTRPRIDKLKPANPYDLLLKRAKGAFELDEKRLPFAFRQQSNWNGAGAWPNNW